MVRFMRPLIYFIAGALLIGAAIALFYIPR